MAAEPRSVLSPIDAVDEIVTGLDIIPFSPEKEDERSVERLIKTNKIAILDGLKGKMQEPWERSLQRLLEEQTNTARGSTTNTPTTYNGRRVTPELILLSRTESRDYALEIEGGMDDNSSIVSRGASPSRRQLDIYRKNSLSNKHGRKSLFDSDDDESEANGTCRLSHKFSTESLFLYHDQSRLEDRCEQEDYSDRTCTDDDPRCVLIQRAGAIFENESQESWLVDMQGSQQRERPFSDLYLPMY
jgi:hypothetical protein